MNKIIKMAVETYQCPGCVVGSDTSCYEKSTNEACEKHVPGSTIMPVIETVFLGMPTGFDRLGCCKKMKICIFRDYLDGWGYDQFNVPVWKHKDEHGNTIVRGLSPRINTPFIHVFLTDCMESINCMEITKEIQEGMV